ncbi:hemerythrin domain-containing protein [Paenibacillus thermotolerans]|uniref:hemerythrin domain-containing protein n=1 Tax=Paenibacillus thermotolerans TaxID=3027807 RepID=UPI002368A58F|nr:MULTISPECIES: hemerythrin domain-containing protein [unclassified Paenibacillus]
MATDMNRTMYDESAHPTELAYALERVREEHAELRAKVAELETAIKIFQTAWSVALATKIVAMAETFSKQCEAHARWEDTELMPFLSVYYLDHGGPEISTSVWMMEKDHELAYEFLRSFLQRAKEIPNRQDRQLWKSAILQLSQACYIYKEHFELEEQVIFSSAFKMLDEIDYLFS